MRATRSKSKKANKRRSPVAASPTDPGPDTTTTEHPVTIVDATSLAVATGSAEVFEGPLSPHQADETKADDQHAICDSTIPASIGSSVVNESLPVAIEDSAGTQTRLVHDTNSTTIVGSDPVKIISTARFLLDHGDVAGAKQLNTALHPKTPPPLMAAMEVVGSSSPPEPPFTPTPPSKRPNDMVDDRGIVKRRNVGNTPPSSPPIWTLTDAETDGLIFELRHAYENLPDVWDVRDLTEVRTGQIYTCNADIWKDPDTRYPGVSIAHFVAIIQLPVFMGYVNPARSVTVGTAVDSIYHGTFKGLVRNGSPLKMISYGIVKYSCLAAPKEVHDKFVKSINIFPLPGEWERTVGFFGTCARTTSLLFSPYHGALSYATRMISPQGISPNVASSVATPRRSTQGEVPHKMSGFNPAGLPLPWDEIPIYDARELCLIEADIDNLSSQTKEKLCQLGNVDLLEGCFVGVVHCARWIPSAKHLGKERVYLSLAEVYLLADPAEEFGSKTAE